MKIYVIGGKAKSGKDTFGKFLREELKKYGYHSCVMHITEPLYGYAKNYFEWDEQQDPKPREFLQKVGIEIIKEKLNKPTFLLDRLNEDIEILSNFFDVFIIVDARLKVEFEELKNRYKEVILIKLERDNFNNGLTDEQNRHITETDIDTYNNFDYIIKNNGIITLKESAKDIIRKENSYE